MPISAVVLADSVGDHAPRLTTFELEMPRFLLAQFNTHRKISKNAASSRAIPLRRRVAMILSDPVMPVRWGKDQPGMVADEEIDPNVRVPLDGEEAELSAEEAWLTARDGAIRAARHLDRIGVHKEVVNRILEPFSYVRVVATAAGYANLFHLRLHKDAQPEFRAVAGAMRAALDASEPRQLAPGEWHLPYVSEELPLDVARMVSAARCARVSYKTHDGRTPALDEDIALYGRLVGNGTIHASPMEHQATPDRKLLNGEWACPGLHGNLTGWCQFRKTLDGEFVAG